MEDETWTTGEKWVHPPRTGRHDGTLLRLDENEDNEGAVRTHLLCGAELGDGTVQHVEMIEKVDGCSGS